jgi:hypothetical protein
VDVCNGLRGVPARQTPTKPPHPFEKSKVGASLLAQE